MATVHLTREQWAFIQPLLPPPACTGRPRADDRRTVEGMLYVLITGCRWQDLPPEYGAPTTVWRRLKWWGGAGIWERIWRAVLATLDVQGKLDWSMVFLNGSFVPAKKGGEYVGLTRKGGRGASLYVHGGHARRAQRGRGDDERSRQDRFTRQQHPDTGRDSHRWQNGGLSEHIRGERRRMDAG
jgi:transposase